MHVLQVDKAQVFLTALSVYLMRYQRYHTYIYTPIIVQRTLFLSHKQHNSTQLPPDIGIVNIMCVLNLTPLLGLMQNL
jgi:hypothetical protein